MLVKDGSILYNKYAFPFLVAEMEILYFLYSLYVFSFPEDK